MTNVYLAMFYKDILILLLMFFVIKITDSNYFLKAAFIFCINNTLFYLHYQLWIKQSLIHNWGYET
jgi:hypothetical protein